MAVIAALCAPPRAAGQTQNLNLAWDANPETDIASYYVHVGTSSGNYNIAVTPVPGNQLTYAFPATPGVRYYFAVRAVNTSGIWSPSSSEVVGGVPTFAQPPNQTANVGTAIAPLQLSATDPDGAALQYSATNLPAGLSISSSGRITGTPTTVQTKNVTVSAFDGTVSVHRSFTWTVNPAPATVAAVSVSPSSGTGDVQTFTLQYSDSLGGGDLATAWVWFNSSFASTAANSCLLYYSQPTNLLYLLNDNGNTWQAVTLGTAASLENSQCSVDAAGASRAVSGNTLTLTLPMVFRSSFSGSKHVYLYGASAGGSNSGWHDRGDWTVPVAASTVTADSVSPGTGSGSSQTFALKYSDGLGASRLNTAWVWFNQTFAPSAANSCLAYYRRSTNTVYLLNDAGTTWQPAQMGAAATLQNSQCAIAVGSSSAALSGTTLTVNLAMTFKERFAGSKNVYAYGDNLAGLASGWQDRGDWTVPSSAGVVTADSATPSAGSGSGQVFTLKYSDTLGATDLRTAWVWLTGAFGASSANSCLVYYDRPSNTLFLINDAGTAWQPAVLGSSTTLRNNACSVNVGGSSAAISGSTLTLNVDLTFAPAYAGAKRIYMYGSSLGGSTSGWQDKGGWTVP